MVVHYLQMGDEVSGRGAAVVIRDRKTGKRRNLKEEAKQKEKEDEKVAQYTEKYSRWGKGCVHAIQLLIWVYINLSWHLILTGKHA
jgi:hypothetical protein